MTRVLAAHPIAVRAERRIAVRAERPTVVRAGRRIAVRAVRPTAASPCSARLGLTRVIATEYFGDV
ncbi:MAG: hypothetical protein ACKOQM_00375 [Novosphingobium sp.]